MRLFIILFFSLCSLVTKAHEHTYQAKSTRLNIYVHLNSGKEHDTFIGSEAPVEQNDLVIDVDDDDSDILSARKYSLLVKSVIIQCYLQLFSDSYQNIHKNQFSCSQSVIYPTDKYITQRVLRI